MAQDKLEHMFVEQLYLEQVFAVPSLLYVWVQCRMVCVSVPVYDGSVLMSGGGHMYPCVRLCNGRTSGDSGRIWKHGRAYVTMQPANG